MAALALLSALIAVLQAAHPPQTPAPPTIHETVVVTATAAPVDAPSLGRSVTTITRAELDLLGISSVTDALRLAPGLDVDARTPHDVQADLSIRGATFGQNLVLLDGRRLNDRQSGHHDAEIPTPVDAIDRIEVLSGAGSAVHGADALGGVVNVITRQDRHVAGRISAGQYGDLAGDLSLGGIGLPPGWQTTAWAERSGAFAPDREFAMGGAALGGPIGHGLTLDVRHERRRFGADGFYGPAPSREWTDQTLASLDARGTRGGWTVDAQGTWKNHGDHFQYDRTQPGYGENAHRDNAADLDLTATHTAPAGGRVTVGLAGGGDWIRSSNLGDHRDAHGAISAELLQPLGARATLQTSLRVDDYSSFGSAASPTAALAVRPSAALKLRASAAHAFRIPSFTELYYHDPANLGQPDLQPERGWSFDGGADLSLARWTASVTPFTRWDRSVIDWVRPSTTDLWRATNVRDVTTHGVEVSLVGHWQAALVRADYTALSVQAPSLTLLSKYVLAYARDAVGLSASAPLGRRVQLSGTLSYRRRVDGQRYWVLDAQISRRLGRVRLFVNGTNLLGTRYQEISGVAMPGRWITAGLILP